MSSKTLIQSTAVLVLLTLTAFMLQTTVSRSLVRQAATEAKTPIPTEERVEIQEIFGERLERRKNKNALFSLQPCWLRHVWHRPSQLVCRSAFDDHRHRSIPSGHRLANGNVAPLLI
jgi:hypothetical protein